jgi:hypothetical protein
MPYFRTLYPIIFLSFLFNQETINLYAQSHKDWSVDKVMYELNVRQYSEAGTFEAIIRD